MDFNQEGFLQGCQKGNIDEIKKNLAQGVDINHQDSEGNSGVHHAAMHGQLEVLHFLEENDCLLNLTNYQGQTALHQACDRNNREIALFLITHGVDPETKNNQNLKAGEGNIESKMFVNSIASESKAFGVLDKQQIQKLTSIFEEIDYENTKGINYDRAYSFNKYVDDNVTDNHAEKDAKDFIQSVAICSKSTVNIDEWLFSFSKLWVVDQSLFEKFIQDYEIALQNKKRFRDWVQNEAYNRD